MGYGSKPSVLARWKGDDGTTEAAASFKLESTSCTEYKSTQLCVNPLSLTGNLNLIRTHVRSIQWFRRYHKRHPLIQVLLRACDAEFLVFHGPAGPLGNVKSKLAKTTVESAIAYRLQQLLVRAAPSQTLGIASHSIPAPVPPIQLPSHFTYPNNPHRN